MKIGLLTFHRATNHGAVLQTFATVKYIKEQFGLDIEVIDYWPKRREVSLKNMFHLNRPKIMFGEFKNYFKEKKIAQFRFKNIPMSKRYYSNDQLRNEKIDYDILLCGSDQIWNYSYFLHGDGRNIITPVYFLDFGKEDVKRIALSVSFGCVEYPAAVGEKIKHYIDKFDNISVRENTGIDILKKLDCNKGIVTADPTSLLKSEDYIEMCKGYSVSSNDYVAIALLRSQNSRVKSIVKSILNLVEPKQKVNIVNCSIEKWLAGIRDAQIVITNSFHCVVMCLKLHTPFFVVNEKTGNQGMNDRFYTLLALFGMLDRIVEISPNAISNLPKFDIDWNNVDKIMDKYSSTLKEFLNENFERYS